MASTEDDGRALDGSTAILNHTTGLRNLGQLIQLRWMAVVGQIATILVVQFGFAIPLPLKEMSAVLILLAGFNVLSILRRRLPKDVGNSELFLALLVDVATLTAQLYFSGGVTNPFIFLYLLQVILGALLLQTWSAWTLVAITGTCFIGLSLSFEPLAMAPPAAGVFPTPYFEGILLCFALNAALLVISVTRINRNLRLRDARLADARERAVQEENIIRMGLLASGAAHELGTPLSTVSVILGDWRRMPAIVGDAELLAEIAEMQTQIDRCKQIVSGVLLSAGDARGESAAETTIRTFLDQLVEEWRMSRSPVQLNYDWQFGEDMRIVSDTAIKQMIFNVLDNALEASPAWVGLQVQRKQDNLQLVVTDKAAGFSAAMLADMGKPYQTTKTRAGAGLGLFLVSNVARTLRGSVAARNRPEGGAEVTLNLPLQSLRLSAELPLGS